VAAPAGSRPVAARTTAPHPVTAERPTGRPQVLLVTGTGTGVGKTVTTAAVAVTAGRAGRRVAIVKPAQTGLAAGEPGDVQEVGRLAGLRPADLHELARLTDPLAPRTAARLSGEPLPPLSAAASFVADLAGRYDLVLVEGAGGVLVELDQAGGTIAGLASRLTQQIEVATVVVAGPGLGTLNHTGLTVEALARRGVPVLGTVLGSWPDEPGLAERCNLDDLPRLTGLPLLGQIPDGAGRLDPATFATRAPGWLSPALGGTWTAPDVQ
jgi:dethiobiotin synthetase